MLTQPIFFPSVSSVSKNRLSALEHIEILTALQHPHFLISAYDIFHLSAIEKEKFRHLRTSWSESGIKIIVDSGMYEKVWAQDDTWNYQNYLTTVNGLEYEHVFNFDQYINPNDAPTKEIIESLEATKIAKTAPILHTTNVTDLPSLCLNIARHEKVKLIAIPERELGNGIIEGIHTVSKIKQALLSEKQDVKIHILGTGNPLSILLYSAFGVDSFDGLDWCQTVVDFESATLHHSLQLDFYAHQSQFGTMEDISYYTRLFAHNLEFYLLWMDEINKEIRDGSIVDMLKYYLPKAIVEEVVELYGIHND